MLFLFSFIIFISFHNLFHFCAFLFFFRKDKARKVEFDFDAIRVLGFKFNLKKGKAAELGAKTGLGSDSNANLVEKGMI